MPLTDKVFIESSTLLAASVYFGKYVHKSYDSSKSLFKLFGKNIPLQIGWSSDTVTSQAKKTLEKVIEDVISEAEGTRFRTEKSIVFFDLMSKIKDDSEDRLIANIRVLTKMPIDEAAVTSIRACEVVPFFEKILEERKKEAKFSVSGIKLPWSLKKAITRTNTPYYKDMPDKTDIRIFAETIYLKRTFIAAGRLFIASLDTHFSPQGKIP